LSERGRRGSIRLVAALRLVALTTCTTALGLVVALTACTALIAFIAALALIVIT
jgi:hypothetical protein